MNSNVRPALTRMPVVPLPAVVVLSIWTSDKTSKNTFNKQSRDQLNLITIQDNDQ